jgi:chromosome segregation ATPase
MHFLVHPNGRISIMTAKGKTYKKKEEYKAKYMDAKEKLKEDVVTKRELRADKDKLEGEVSSLKQQIRYLKDVLNNQAYPSYHDAAAEATALREELRVREENLRKKQDEIKQLKKEVDDLKEDNKNLRNENNTNSADARDWKRQWERARDTIRTLQARLAERADRRPDWRDEVRRLQEEKDILVGDVNRVRRERNLAIAAKELAVRQKDQAEDEIAYLRDRLRRCRC